MSTRPTCSHLVIDTSSTHAGRLSTTAVDVIFTRYRAANSRRMSFKDFIAALAAVAYEMGFQFDDIMEALGARSQQPLAPADGVVSRLCREALGRYSR
jgi:hypothetical protein